VEAISEAVKTNQEFLDFNTAIKTQRPLELGQWEDNYNAWFERKGWDRNDIKFPFRDMSESKPSLGSMFDPQLIGLQ
jgi:hypothetical protein